MDDGIINIQSLQINTHSFIVMTRPSSQLTNQHLVSQVATKNCDERVSIIYFGGFTLYGNKNRSPLWH